MIPIINIIITTILSYLTLSLFPHFRLLGVVPLLPLFFIIQYAYYRKGFEPLLAAVITGIFFDLVSPSPFGFYLMLFLLTAGSIRYFFEEGLRNFSFWHYLVVSGLAILVFQLGQLFYINNVTNLINLKIIWPLVSYMLVNLGYATLMFFVGVWYFEWLLGLEDYLKRK